MTVYFVSQGIGMPWICPQFEKYYEQLKTQWRSNFTCVYLRALKCPGFDLNLKCNQSSRKSHGRRTSELTH